MAKPSAELPNSLRIAFGFKTLPIMGRFAPQTCPTGRRAPGWAGLRAGAYCSWVGDAADHRAPARSLTRSRGPLPTRSLWRRPLATTKPPAKAAWKIG